MRKRKLTSAAARILGLVLTAAMIFTALPGVPLKAAAEDPNFVVRSFIHWHRVRVQSDITTGLCMLLWGGTNNAQYVNAGPNYKKSDKKFYGTATSNYPEIDVSLDDFFTLPDEINNTFELELTGRTDSENGNLKRVRLKVNQSGYIWDAPMQLGSGNPDDKDFDWGVATSEVNTDYSDNTGAGKVQFFHNQSGDDLAIGYDGSAIRTYGSSSYDYPDFIMYIGKKMDFTVFDSFTVEAGTSYEMRGNCLLDNGCTITIEPGAVLSISGRFINDGYIENYGTLIIREDATVSTFGQTNSDAGCVTCYGQKSLSPGGLPGEGDLVVLGGAKVCLPDNACGLVLGEGTSCVNNGIMIVPSSILLDGGQLLVTEKGYLFTGTRLPARMFDLDTLYVIDPDDPAFLSVVLALVFAKQWPMVSGTAHTGPWILRMTMTSTPGSLLLMNNRNYVCVDGYWIDNSRNISDGKTVYDLTHHYAMS